MWGELFALLAAGAFALSTVLSRRFMIGGPGRPPVSPEAGVFVSMVTNVAVFGVLTILEALGGGFQRLTWQSAALFALGGIGGTLLGRNLAYLSVLRIGPSRSTAIRLSNTLFAALLGLWWLRELPRGVQIAGAVLITAGLWTVVSERGSQRRTFDAGGILAAVAAAAAFALGDTSRRVALGITPQPFIGASIGAATALAVQAVWLGTRRLRGSVIGVAWRADVVGSALGNTAAILLLFLALQRTTVANASVLYNLQVLLVIFLSRRMLRGDESTGRRLVIGSLVCLVGTAAVLFG
ncbi:MAG: EamA family transporter [Armatimonadota bacterium]|nr:EamA family transporter [Armatimonadota bacterium]MDR5696785.1 EamA family transporter [Armatimonadota bacterium]